jgi:disulfide oxidoreductase YuzD
MLKKVVLLVSVNILAANVQASEVVKGNLNFYSEMAQLAKSCDHKNCNKPYQKELVENQKMDKNLKKTFEMIAHKQAQVWGDTILEGDYVAEGKTRLDQVYKLYKNNEIIAYQIVYSEKAWNISDCAYDGNAATLLGCVTGRIVESSYVSLDFKEYFYDENTAAVFK